MIFTNIFTPALQFFAAVQSILIGTKLDEFTCPSTQQINEKIKAGDSMIFPVEGIAGNGFEYRNNNNQRVQHYNRTNVKKLNTVYFQTKQDGLNASANCDYVDNRGIRFSLAALPKTVDSVDTTKMNRNAWSDFFGGGLKDCGYRKMPEEQILEECKFPMKNN
ncbi:hypothetical protein [Rickettsiella endosymbiont of Aleochara curtula]|uniref:hypothetical protein n=1 Tax=Rickettsiella endosymbiont of Aleochara curtula TaxID=3077936 RepID=UPI00313D061F